MNCNTNQPVEVMVAGPALIFAGLQLFIVLRSPPWMVMGVLLACLGGCLGGKPSGQTGWGRLCPICLR
jgi:hypothetical protein